MISGPIPSPSATAMGIFAINYPFRLSLPLCKITMMLKKLFEDQRRYLNHFFDNIDLEDSQKILDKLLCCKGVVIFSGVGKSGHIAAKLAATFSSIGTR